MANHDNLYEGKEFQDEGGFGNYIVLVNLSGEFVLFDYEGVIFNIANDIDAQAILEDLEEIDPDMTGVEKIQRWIDGAKDQPDDKEGYRCYTMLPRWFLDRWILDHPQEDWFHQAKFWHGHQ